MLVKRRFVYFKSCIGEFQGVVLNSLNGGSFWCEKSLKCGIFLLVFCISISSVKGQQKGASVNLLGNFKELGVSVTNFDERPLVHLVGENYAFAAISRDHKYVAIARSYPRGESDIKDIVLVNLKKDKEFVLLDTLSMVRYGRPQGLLWSIEFNEQNQLIAKIGDGNEKSSVLTFDIDKKTIIKDVYIDDYEGEDEEFDEDTLLTRKISDLKRIFPQKTEENLMEWAYKLQSIDTVGYLLQGISAKDNSIYFLAHNSGRLKLLHNIVDKTQTDNIDGVWGNSKMFFYLLKDKAHDYLFQYNIQSNMVSLLKKLPAHTDYSYIYSQKLVTGEVILYFESESGLSAPNEVVKLFRYSNGELKEINDYPLLQEIQILEQENLIMLYYLQDGKRCLDIRKLQ